MLRHSNNKRNTKAFTHSHSHLTILISSHDQSSLFSANIIFIILQLLLSIILINKMLMKLFWIYRASDISRGRGPAKFRYFREIPRNSQKNTKYREIRQKYFQIHVGKTHLILILAIRPVLFTSNVQIYLETIRHCNE